MISICVSFKYKTCTCFRLISTLIYVRTSYRLWLLLIVRITPECVDAVKYWLTQFVTSPCLVGSGRDGGGVLHIESVLVYLISDVRIASCDGRRTLVAARRPSPRLAVRRRAVSNGLRPQILRQTAATMTTMSSLLATITRR